MLIYGTSKDDFAHANLIGLVDKNNRLRGLYDAGDTEKVTPEFLARTVKKLARE